VRRSALIGIGKYPNQKPVIIIAPLKMPATETAKKQLRNELKELGQKNELTKEIKTVLLHTGFPVDIRHNAKIRREELKDWATLLLNL
jgi:hypothetical protein